MRQVLCTALRAVPGLILLLGAAGCVTASDLEKLDQGLSQKLDQGLTKTQETVTATVRTEMGGLRAEVSELRTVVHAKVDELRAEVAEIRTAQGQRQNELAKGLDVVRTTLEAEVVGLRQLVETLKNDTKATLAQVEVSQAMQHKLLTAARADQATLKDALADHAAANAQELVKLQGMTDRMAGQIQALQTAVSTLTASLQQLPPALATLRGEMQSLSQTMLGTYKLEEAALRVRLKALEEGIKQLEPPATPKEAASGSGKGGGTP